MINDKQFNRIVQKMARFCGTLEDRLFVKAGEIPLRWYQTRERLYRVPEESLFSPVEPGTAWGGEGAYCWFRGSYSPPPELAGKRLYARPRGDCNEGMLWVDGEPFGVITRRKPLDGSRGNHHCALLTLKAEPGKPLDAALEFYAGHVCIGTQPLSNEVQSFDFKAGNIDVCTRDELIAEFLFDLRVVVDMEAALEENSFRRADVLNALREVHRLVYYDPDNVDDEPFRAALKAAGPILKDLLNTKNGSRAPFAGLIGHSHMDTAWLWTLAETEKKCVRTYANQLALMDQYPEYLFIQSSAYHSEIIRRRHPALFERIKQRVREGRYEPNGGVWVECDCNIVSGESMARQFLWGQRYTMRHFNYRSDSFWLPDTFGYSPAIPQIMLLSGVKYFLTTKMTWNDTNRFPYDSFYWQGLDGSRVLTHLNRSHLWPTPKNLTEYLVHGRQSGDPVKEKTVSRRRLFSFGYGDGGGGPQFEMLEMARRIADVDGLPRSGYTRVGDFMKALETEIRDPSIYAGELYLELHRGTLTNQHRIKRNNRLGEIALHDLEYAAVRRALGEGKNPSGAEIDPLTETLLINQFHDILPGTCIPPVHEQSLRETSTLIEKARRMSAELLSGPDAEGTVTVTNTLSFPRQDPFYLEDGDYDLPDGAVQQRVDTLEGRRTAVSGLRLEAFSGKTLSRKKAPSQAGADTAGPFRHEGGVLETPFARITFAANGTIESLIDKSAGNRELRGEGYPLGTFLIAEDLPQSWDNWDLDADIEDKFQDCSGLLERKVIAQGPVEFRIRSLYRLSPKSTLEQDLVFYAASPLIRYETMIDWQDNHRFLKAAFDTSIHAAEARHEIQFGHIRRSVFRGTDIEKAKFEVSNHKYTDISETRYGAALLNDCKYGISVQGGRMRLSLHKGGNRPDFKGDLGRHYCAYGFLPHRGGFSVETVVRPAYTFNYRPLITPGRGEMPSLLRVDAPTVIVETVKPCEEAGRAFILRLYECEGAWTPAALTVPGAREIRETNILEEDTGRKAAGPEIRLEFRPFEIKTLRVEL